MSIQFSVHQAEGTQLCHANDRVMEALEARKPSTALRRLRWAVTIRGFECPGNRLEIRSRTSCDWYCVEIHGSHCKNR